MFPPNAHKQRGGFMEHVVWCKYQNGVDGAIEADPEMLIVNPGDTIQWKNQLSEPYRATKFVPKDPSLFGKETIDIPVDSPSAPQMVVAKPGSGSSFTYKYWLEPVDPAKQSLDPVIVVVSPTNPPQNKVGGTVPKLA